MKRISCYIVLTLVLSLVFLVQVTSQEYSIGGELGATLFSGFQYEAVSQKGGFFRRAHNVSHNEGWIFNYYPDRNRLFFSIAYTRFHPDFHNIYAEVDKVGTHRVSSGAINHIFSFNVGHQLDIGKYISLKKDRCFFEPFYGVGLEWIRGNGISSINGPLIYLTDFESKRGWSTSLQGGFRLSYRYQRSKFSLKMIGNLGLRYYAISDFRVDLPEPVTTRVQSKGDFIAAQVSYEYLFKSNWTKKKKRHLSENTTLERDKIQEIKIGIHPYAIGRYISLNYELFPIKRNKSLYLDVTYFNDRRGVPVNTSDDPINSEYELRIFREPRLDIHIGQQLYSEKADGYKWGIGYYIRSETRIAQNQKFNEAYTEAFDIQSERSSSYYFALGSNLQYKWLLGDRWILAPMLLTDLGVGSGDMGDKKHRTLFRPIYLDVQGRLYVGYRF